MCSKASFSWSFPQAVIVLQYKDTVRPDNIKTEKLNYLSYYYYYYYYSVLLVLLLLPILKIVSFFQQFTYLLALQTYLLALQTLKMKKRRLIKML